MAYTERRSLYADLEQYRQRALIAYVTNLRDNAGGGMELADLPEFLDQVHRLPPDCSRLDLLVVSYGGDGDVAWQIMPILRERFQHVAVLLPACAFSAATLLALGADEIVMHPSGQLGPVDPQFAKDPMNPDISQGRQRFNYDELLSFLSFLREKAKVQNPAGLLEQYFEEVGASAVGLAAAASQNGLLQAEELLAMHMKPSEAKRIATELNTRFHHHGHAITRAAAKKLGLPIAHADQTTEAFLWRIWLDVERELEMRRPFIPAQVVAESEHGKRLLEGVCGQGVCEPCRPEGGDSGGDKATDPEHRLIEIEPTPYELTLAVMESRLLARRRREEGTILAVRSAKPELRVKCYPLRSEWETVFEDGATGADAAEA